MVLEKLVEFSNFYGSNEELVLAGGGNTSAKEGDVMYIKGSGTSLSTITADGFVKMSRQALADIFTKEYPTDDDAREAQALADLISDEERNENYIIPNALDPRVAPAVAKAVAEAARKTGVARI